MKICIIWIALTVVVVPMACGAGTTTGALKVGVVLPLTGDYAKFGEIQRNSFLLAMEHINKAGGVKGQSVTLIFEDDNGQPDLARSAAAKLILEYGVLVLTGARVSESGREIAALAEQRRVPFLVTSASADDITEHGWKYVFRIGPPLSQYFGPMLSFLKTVVKPRTLAVVYENSFFGKKASEQVAQAFRKMGGEVVAQEAYRVGATDFKRILVRVKDARPDVVFIAAAGIEGAFLVRQSQELNLTPKIFVGGAQVFTHLQFMLGAGVASDYVFSVNLWSPRLPYPGAQKYFDDYALRFLSSTNYYGAEAYACMQVIADALHRAESFTPDHVRQALAETDLKTVFGPVRFVSKGKKTQQNFVPTFLGQWQDGVLETVWPKEFASDRYVYPVPPWTGGP